MAHLAKSIVATETPITMASAVTVGSYPGEYTLEDEAVLVTGGSGGTSLSVLRGARGTAAVSHAAGTELVVVDPTPSGGGGGVSVTVQDADPGAVGAGNLWVRTDAAANYAPVLLVRNPTNDGWVDQATGGYYLGSTAYRDNGTVALSVFTTPNADNYEIEMWGAPLTRIADFLMYRDSGGVIWLRSMDETSADKSSVKIAPTGIELTGIPTADPHVVGQLWNASGTLKISAG